MDEIEITTYRTVTFYDIVEVYDWEGAYNE